MGLFDANWLPRGGGGEKRKGKSGGIGVAPREEMGLIAGSPPSVPPAEGTGTVGWPGPPGELCCCPRPPLQSSAQSDRKPSGRSPGCHGSGGTQSCPDLAKQVRLYLGVIRK